MFSSIKEYKDNIKQKKISVNDAVMHYYNIAKKNKHNEFITLIDEEGITSQIKESEERIDKGQERSLEGVPVVIKDNICVKNIKTTAGSKMLSNFTPGYDATVVSNLKNAGAIIIGKANMDEFGMGGSNENSAYGPCINSNPNPITQEMNLSPGGSSGGSAVSVSSGSSLLSLGTDTGGSVRQPAHLCGIYGIKPTYGSISRSGVIAYASSFDQVGIFANSPDDIAIAFEQMYGFDKKDSTMINKVKDILNFSKVKERDVSSYSFAILSDKILDNVNEETISKIEELSKICTSSLGMKKKSDIDLKYFSFAGAIYYTISTAECFSNLSRYDGIIYGQNASSNIDSISDLYLNNRTEGFGSEVKKRMAIGAMSLSQEHYDKYFVKTAKIRRLLTEEMINALNDTDIIIMPVTDSFGDVLGEAKEKNQVDRCLSDKFTFPANCAGLPALTIPFGKSKDGFNIGLQLVSRHLRDDVLLQVANAIKAATE